MNALGFVGLFQFLCLAVCLFGDFCCLFSVVFIVFVFCVFCLLLWVAYGTLVSVKIYELVAVYINNMNIHLAITLLPKCCFVD